MKEAVGFSAVDRGQVARGGQVTGMFSLSRRVLLRFRRVVAEKVLNAFFILWHAGSHRALVGLWGSLWT